MRRTWPEMGCGASEGVKTRTVNKIIQFHRAENIAVNYILHNKTKIGP
jgi:hypothetical protein